MANIIPIGLITDDIPEVKRKRPIRTLGDLFTLFSESKAYKRYGHCWDYFPLACTLEDLDKTAQVIREHLKVGYISQLIIETPPDYRIEYGELSRDKLLRMLRCLHSLRKDLLKMQSAST